MTVRISISVNGKTTSAQVDERTLLVTWLREILELTGTHVGCDTSQCGACTVHVDGRAIKSCSVLAVQMDGANVVTIEGISEEGGALHPVQKAFHEHHGLQCGFCTPGMVMSAIDLLGTVPQPSEEQIREQLDGNLCRCTGYSNIVRSIRAASSASSCTAIPAARDA